MKSNTTTYFVFDACHMFIFFLHSSDGQHAQALPPGVIQPVFGILVRQKGNFLNTKKCNFTNTLSTLVAYAGGQQIY